MNAIDHARLLKFTQSLLDGGGKSLDYFADGRLVYKIRSYKLARAFDNILLAYIDAQSGARWQSAWPSIRPSASRA